MTSDSTHLEICEFLGLSQADVEKLFAQGEAFLDHIEGGTVGKLNLPSGRHVFLSPKGFARLAPGMDALKRMRKINAQGGSFADAVKEDASALRPEKRGVLQQAGQRRYYDLEVCRLPLAGVMNQEFLDLAGARYRQVLSWMIGAQITPDVDAVVEVGANVGRLVVGLALERLNSATRFFATDLSRNFVLCAAELAKIAGVHNVTAREFDIEHPDFGFLEDCKNVVFIGSTVFSWVPRLRPFLQALADFPGKARLCAFEPCGDQMASRFRDHTPLVKNASTQLHPGYVPPATLVWDIFCEFTDRGILTLEKAIPDLIGRQPAYPLSLIQVRNW